MKFDLIVRTAPLNRIDFRVHAVSLCIINAARRAMMSEVKSAAFSYDICIPDAPGTGVRVVSNTTTLHNEMLAHRFSFIPIHLTENEQERFQIDPTRYKFSLRVKNKGAAGAAAIDVTSHDIHVTDTFGVALSSEVRDAMFPPDPITKDHILIVCLRPSPIGDGLGEEVAIDAVASASNGHVSCRWSPVSLCTFKNVVNSKIADAAYSALAEKLGDAPIQSRAQFDTLEAHRCFDKDAHGDPFEFDVSIESVCGLRPEYIFYKALRIISQRVSDLALALAPVAPAASASAAASAAADENAEQDPVPPPSTSMSITLDALPNTDDFYALTIAGEGHTLGNLVQGLMYETHVRDKNSEKLTFVGYHVAHPLDQSICMKFKVTPGVVIRDFLVEALQGIVTQIDSVALEWTHPSALDKAGIRDVDAFIANIPVRTVQ